jgi:hypothetical protein
MTDTAEEAKTRIDLDRLLNEGRQRRAGDSQREGCRRVRTSKVEQAAGRTGLDLAGQLSIRRFESGSVEAGRHEEAQGHDE